MNFEPQKFFIGLVDFFSILLPGGLLTYLRRDTAGPWILGKDYHSPLGSEAWMVFLFTSYLLGHFLFLIGSWLDEWAYNPIRKMTDREQIMRLSSGRDLSPKPLRWLALVCFKKRADAAVARVVPIKEGYLNRIEAPNTVNAFQWCKVRLAIEKPEALATVNRFEADSKFFRSLVVVLPILIYWEWAKDRPKITLIVVLLLFLVLAFWRYMEQRFKATQQAHWTILTLEAGKQPPSSSTELTSCLNSGEKSVGPTHAGGVVFRKRSDHTEYLLVQAKADPFQWVLPKGHIEPGEDTRRCAIREVREETGVWARIKGELKVIEYTLADQPVKAQFYLMEAVEEGNPEDRWRKHAWLSLEQALKQATHRETHELLRLAEQQRNLS